MRSSKVTLFGLAIALAGATSAKDALADVTIDTSTTTPLTTSVSGDVTVTSAGSITVEEGETAITVDSTNDVTIDSGGDLLSEDADSVRGVVLQGGAGGNIVLNGSIQLVEDYTLEDTDDDGDLDGSYAQGTDRIGIFLQSGTFTGDLTTGSSSSIAIEGNDSAAIRLDGLLDGDLTLDGSLRLTGDNGQAVAIGSGGAGGVTGDVKIDSTIAVLGTGSNGVLVDGAIDGSLSIGGSISVTGYHSTNRPASDDAAADLDADDLQQGGAAVEIRYNVADGVEITGVGVEDDLDDDGDGILDEDGDDSTEQDTDDDATAAITSYGSAPAIFISPDAAAPANLTLGAGASGYGFVNRGSVASGGVYDGVSATGIWVLGRAGGAVNIEGGILNDGAVTAAAFEANAYGLRVGNFVSTPEILSRRLISSSVASEGDDTAYGVLIDGSASVPTLTNTGIIRATLSGEVGDAIAIADQSNSLAEINNSGVIFASVIATDDDITDDVDPIVTGSAYAIDVGTSTIDVTINQTPDVPFTDDDTVDDDEDDRPDPSITGDIRLGSGADTINLGAGAITGDIEFGAGADTLRVTGNSVFTGNLSDSGGDLSLDVVNGAVLLEAGDLSLSNADFGANGRLGVVLSPEAGEATNIEASGTVTFADGSQIVPTVPRGLPQQGTQTFLTATTLIGAENVIGAVAPGSAPFLYNVDIDVVDTNPNALEANFEIKSTEALGLNANEATAFDEILRGLRLNEDAAAAISGIYDQVNFIDAYDDLMPSFSSSAAELASTAIQQQQSTASNRLNAYRAGQVRDRSVWGQEIAYGLNREPDSVNAQEYRGYGFGFAAGIDRPIESGAIVGASLSFITSQMEEPDRPDGEISASFGQINGYFGSSLGAFNLDVVAGLGAGKLTERRFIEIGDDFTASTEADWWAYEGHGAVHLSLPVQMGRFTVTPRTSLTYVAMNEQGYTEEGAGPGLDWEADSAFSQRLWGDAAVEIGARFGRENDPRANVIVPRLMVGYRANLIDEGAERSFRLASGGGNEFTLTDEGYGDGGVLAGLGVTAGNAYSSFSLAYEGEFGDELTRHSLNASVRINF
ncbi:MAG: autotransporter domain-containing protein [Hyphomonadaceae bacterium]|nr:autotransporter domain-containing protein [Hyphomonadaceae bacterium]